jgi:D-glycero-alpha-D-manno-heptose 1-phosphate guanylyltransferase
MQVNEAIILAGGLGTRLRTAVPDLPKCMAPVNGKPFISYVIRQLTDQGIERFIFSLGYRSEDFVRYLSELLPAEKYTLVIEPEPLGTGGAIQLACTHSGSENIVAMNGDSIFKVDLRAQAEFHDRQHAACTVALKYLENFDRYGTVELDTETGAISAFREKKHTEKGYINGGVYLLKRSDFLSHNWPEKFSFETDYLQAYYNKEAIQGFVQNGYFIDIGVPEDYRRAQTELTY